MDRPGARNGEIRPGGSVDMPRAPLAGLVAGVAGLLWAAFGLAIAAWVAVTALDPARGYDLAIGALGHAGVELPWSHDHFVRIAIDHLVGVAIVAAVALLLAWSGLRKARIAFRPGNVSDDGKGELQVSAVQPRVGRRFDGTIRLRDAPAPGEEYEVTLTAMGPSGVTMWRAEHRARARPGAQGVNLPFHFDVPASAPPSAGGHRWRLEFAPAGRQRFGRSGMDVTLGAPTEAERRVASVPRAEAHAPPPVTDTAAPRAAAAATQVQAQVERIEKLYGMFGAKPSERQRAMIREKLSSQEAADLDQLVKRVRNIGPGHAKLFKYVAIGAVIVFFVLPFAMSVLGFVLAAVFGR